MRGYIPLTLKSAFVCGAAALSISATTPPLSEAPKEVKPAAKSELAAAQIPELSTPSQEIQTDKSTRMTVPVSINGSKTFPFVVDTGAERTVISKELGAQLGLTSGPKLKLATISGPAVSDSYMLDKLTMNSISVDGIEAPALDQNDMGAYGLLGIDSLEKHKVHLDFKSGAMSILPSQRKRTYRKRSRGVIVVTARRRAGRLVLTNAKLNGMDIDIVIDTGAQSSMGNNALRRRLKRSQRKREYIQVGLTSVTGADLVGDFTQIREIEFGGVTITDLPITFTRQYAFKALNLQRRPAMLLGMDAMRLFDSVEIDFANKRVAFDLPRNSRRQSPDRLALNDPSGL